MKEEILTSVSLRKKLQMNEPTQSAAEKLENCENQAQGLAHILNDLVTLWERHVRELSNVQPSVRSTIAIAKIQLEAFWKGERGTIDLASRHSGQAVDRQEEWTQSGTCVRGTVEGLTATFTEWQKQDAELREIIGCPKDCDHMNALQCLQSFVATERQRDMCDACVGTGKPISGKPCMCNGTGRMSEGARTLRSQLLSALAAIEKHNKIVQHTTVKALKIEVDPSLLHQHDAEVRKPLVEAGSKLANLLKDSYWVQYPLDVAKAANELLDALVKVKEKPTNTIGKDPLTWDDGL